MVGRERYHVIADMPPRKLVKLVRIYVIFLIPILLNLCLKNKKHYTVFDILLGPVVLTLCYNFGGTY
jgi:hypothetical protein